MQTVLCMCLMLGSSSNSMAMHTVPVHSNIGLEQLRTQTSNSITVTQVIAMVFSCRHLTMLTFIAFYHIISHINPR